MPTALSDYQHELCTDDGETPLLLFGTLITRYLTTVHPAIEAGDPENGDVKRVREDGIAFGEDFAGGKSATFEIAVLTDDMDDPRAEGADLLDQFDSVWSDPALRSRSSQIAVLRSHMTPGRVRRAYGRPRRYADTPSGTTKHGLTQAVCDFMVGDGLWYDDNEKMQTCRLIPPSEGGLKAPLAAPLSTTAAVEMMQVLTVGGSRKTWPVVTFHGPVTNPSVKIGDLTIGLRITIDSGNSITFDPRPWMRTVRRQDGASKAGSLTYETPSWKDCQVPPGSHTMTYSGTDMTGTSYCEVRWRDAFTRW